MQTPLPMVSPSPQLSDIQHHWARPFIQGLLTKNVVNGFPDGTFRPDRAMTRAEFAAILQKAFSRPKVRQYAPFVDVPSNFWATSAIQKAFETGFISGFPKQRFLPNDNISRVQVLLSLASGLGIAAPAGITLKALSLQEIYQDASEIPGYAIDAIALATRAKFVINYPKIKIFNPNRGATRGEVAAFIYQALVFIGQAPAIASAHIVEISTPEIVRQGTNISLNGKSITAPWIQWVSGLSLRTAIADAVKQIIGIELLNTNDATKQPVEWFSLSANSQILATRQEGAYRYLDISDLANAASWQIEFKDNILSLVTGDALVQNITFIEQSPGSKIVIDLNRATPWQIRQEKQQWIATIDALPAPAILERFKPRPAEPQPNPVNTNPQPTGDKNEGETGNIKDKSLPPTVESNQNKTIIRGNLPDGLGVRTSTLANPNRAVIELRSDALVERDILWSSGLRWRQQYLTLGKERFPVFWLNLNLRSSGITLKPIWLAQNSVTGTAPLIQIATKSQVSAAINGGFFDRNSLLPLGAIRSEGRWLSSPILNRGAIAWDDSGIVKMGRLTVQETLITSSAQRLPVVLFNSGYVQRGIARYTPDWGANYTPLNANEILIIVQNNQVTNQIAGGTENRTAIAIPRDGYLLTLRSTPETANSLTVGTKLQIESSAVPADFNQFPHILGAGPLLMLGGQIILDAKAENFSDAFVKQSAIRSAIGTTAAGELLVVTVHNRIGGAGPNLTETAQLMQQLGAVDALNLDGGSSTSLYLGGQLLNRSPDTAAKVHNGLGIFLA
jgi:hypothetical protein